MNKIDSTTPSGAQLHDNDVEGHPASPPMTAKPSETPAEEKSWGGDVLESIGSPFGFNPKDLAGPAESFANWATHDQDDLSHLVADIQADPKKALSSMKDGELRWCLEHLGNSDKKSVLAAMSRAGITKPTAGEKTPTGVPHPPALYEVNQKQSPAVRDFLHEVNVSAARDYAADYSAYASRNPSNAAPMANLREPGTGAAVFEKMNLSRAKGPSDYLVGKTDDMQQAVDPSVQMAKMGPGDELKMSLGVEGSLAKGSLGGSLDLKVKRQGEAYVISPQLSVTGGVTVSKDAETGNKLKAALGVFAGVELKASSPAEAQKLTGLMGKAASGSLTGDEKDFLQKHISGYDLKGSEALKLTMKQQEGVSLMLSAGAKAEASAHYDIASNTVTVTTKGGLDAGVQAALKASALSGTHSIREASGEVALETKYELPKSVKTVQEALKAIGEGNAKATPTLKVKLDSSGDAGLSAEVAVSGLDSVNRALAAASIDPKSVGIALATDPKTTAKLDFYRTDRDGADLRLSVGDNSLKLSGTAVNTHHEERPATFKEAMKQLASR